jgi:hypothetical protein
MYDATIEWHNQFRRRYIRMTLIMEMAHFTQLGVIYEIGGFKYMWTNQI